LELSAAALPTSAEASAGKMTTPPMNDRRLNDFDTNMSQLASISMIRGHGTSQS
jgi:hypothetical protein